MGSEGNISNLHSKVVETLEKTATANPGNQFNEEVFNYTLELLSLIALADEDLSNEEFQILTNLKTKLGVTAEHLNKVSEPERKLEILKIMESIINKMNQGGGEQFKITFQNTVKILGDITNATQKKLIMKLAKDIIQADGKIHPNETKLIKFLIEKWR